jgi:isopenicillin-N epimerase
VKLSQPHVPIAQWALSPDVEHVNHGSYGGCPRSVIDAATDWRTRLEAVPMRFFVVDWQPAIDDARSALAMFLGAPVERLSFVPNATTAVAIALASSALASGDEILVTDHGYRAVKNQAERLAAERGGRVVTVDLPRPFDADAAVDAILGGVTARTSIVVLDHITSPTGLVLPIERIAPVLCTRGVQLIIDGAHAPGQLALDVETLLASGVTWYAGNNHKWLCAPKGTGFLAGSASARPPRPVVTSHGGSAEYGPTNRYHAELDWMGTHDPTSHLCVPVAIDAVARMGNGWKHVIARNHALAVEMRARLAAGLGSSLLAPDASIGAMGAVPITLPSGTGALELEKQLLADGWELPIVDFRHGPLVRISAHLYNHADQADAVARTLHQRGVRGRSLER